MHFPLQVHINIGKRKASRSTVSGLLTTSVPTLRHLDQLTSTAKLSLFCFVSLETQIILLSQGITI